ncbi:MAG TPA: type II toxin-antitoxin system VapB family antitoxin [Candidatus Obscuribacterales bacterium]
MGMNIKNEETQRLVRELAELTGESQTAAITAAVRERLNRIRRARGRSLSEELLLLGQDCAKRLKEPFLSKDHGDLLYDDKGLPN